MSISINFMIMSHCSIDRNQVMITILGTILIFTLNYAQAQQNMSFSINSGITYPFGILIKDEVYKASSIRRVVSTTPGLYVTTDLLIPVSKNDDIGIQFAYQKFTQNIKSYGSLPEDFGPNGPILGSHSFADLSISNIGAGVVYRRHIGPRWSGLISASLSFPLNTNTGYQYFARRDTIDERQEFDSKIRYHSDIAVEYTLLHTKSVKMKLRPGVSVFLNNTVKDYPLKNSLRNINPFLLVGLELK